MIGSSNKKSSEIHLTCHITLLSKFIMKVKLFYCIQDDFNVNYCGRFKFKIFHFAYRFFFHLSILHLRESKSFIIRKYE